MMPPANAPRPDRATLDGLAATVEATIDRAAAAAPNPGAPVLHRLNRAEYANAVRDLLDSAGRCRDAAARRRLERGLRQHGQRARRLAGADAGLRLGGGEDQPSGGGRSRRSAPTSPPICRRAGCRRRCTARGCRSARAAACSCSTCSRSTPNTSSASGAAASASSAWRRWACDDEVEITLDGERVQLVGPDAAARRHQAQDSRRPAHDRRRRRPPRATRAASTTCSPSSRTRPACTASAINGPLNPTGPGDTPSRRRIFSLPAARPPG